MILFMIFVVHFYNSDLSSVAALFCRIVLQKRRNQIVAALCCSVVLQHCVAALCCSGEGIKLLQRCVAALSCSGGSVVLERCVALEKNQIA